jgi:alpha-tubulin suppressor-like RCC1 family protein
MIRCRTFLPKKIEIKGNIKDLQCGKTFSTFISNKNEAFVCGVNDLNQLGIDQPENMDHIFNKDDIFNNKCFDVIYPTPIECFFNMKVIQIACGESHCLAVLI